MEYFSWKRFKLSPPLIKELTQQFRRPARALLVAFGPADLEEPPGCFFPLGFRFLGGELAFCGTSHGLFAEGPTYGRPCRYLKRRQLLLTENKKARNIISLCVSVVIFCERWSRPDHIVKCVGEEVDGFWQLLVWDQIIRIDYFFAQKVIQGGRNVEWVGPQMKISL